MGIVKFKLIAAIAAITLLSCDIEQKEPAKTENVVNEKELMEAIEARFMTWKDDDFDAHMNTYHSDWKRWSMRKDKLLKKDDFIGLWDRMKKNEKCLDMKVELVDYDILANGEVAIVHFTSKETFEWIGEDNDDGRKNGDKYLGAARWSDVLVKQDGEWKCIGGHRDNSRSEAGLVLLNE